MKSIENCSSSPRLMDTPSYEEVRKADGSHLVLVIPPFFFEFVPPPIRSIFVNGGHGAGWSLYFSVLNTPGYEMSDAIIWMVPASNSNKYAAVHSSILPSGVCLQGATNGFGRQTFWTNHIVDRTVYFALSRLSPHRRRPLGRTVQYYSASVTQQ